MPKKSTPATYKPQPGQFGARFDNNVIVPDPALNRAYTDSKGWGVDPGEAVILPAHCRDEAIGLGATILPDDTECVLPKLINGRQAGKVFMHGGPLPGTYGDIEQRFLGYVRGTLDPNAPRIPSDAHARAIAQCIFNGVPEDVAIRELAGLRDRDVAAGVEPLVREFGDPWRFSGSKSAETPSSSGEPAPYEPQPFGAEGVIRIDERSGDVRRGGSVDGCCV